MTRYKDNDPGLYADYRESLQYKQIIERVAAATQVDDAIIWGIGSRESAWGRTLKPTGPRGTGDHSERKPKPPIRAGVKPPDGLGFGRGLMQIDYDSHEFARSGDWRDPDANIGYAIRNVLIGNIIYLKRNIPSLMDDDLMQAAIAGYNCGAGMVRKLIQQGASVDKFTAHGNYSVDVIARGHWFRDGGGWTRK